MRRIYREQFVLLCADRRKVIVQALQRDLLAFDALQLTVYRLNKLFDFASRSNLTKFVQVCVCLFVQFLGFGFPGLPAQKCVTNGFAFGSGVYLLAGVATPSVRDDLRVFGGRFRQQMIEARDEIQNGF